MSYFLRWSISLWVIVLFAVFAVYYYAEAFSWTSPPNTVAMHGYAWSDNIGWISFNCDNDSSCLNSDYKVTIDASDGSLDGYAWSDNIGWIKFGGLSGFPEGSNGNASLDFSGSDVYIYGWARACVGTAPLDCSSMIDNPNGWNGWISFNCDDLAAGCSDIVYGPKVSELASEGAISSAEPYAWGGDVIGWITMAGVTFDQPYTPGNFACSADYSISYSRDMWGTETANTCSSGRVCSEDSFACKDPISPSVINFSADPYIVRTDETSTISWEVDPATAHTCTLRGPGGDIGTPGLTGSETSTQITARTQFELWCQQLSADGEVLGSEVLADSLSIQTISKQIEI